MKKQFLFIFLLIALFATSAKSSPIGIRLGPQASLLYSQWKYSNSAYKYTPQFGYTLGLSLRVKILKIYFQPELAYSNRRSTFEYDVSGTHYSNAISISTLDARLLFGVSLFKLESFALRFFAGPTISYIINQKIDNKTVSTSSSGFKDYFSTVRAGVGFDFGNWNLDAGYDFGLGNAIKTSGEKLTMGMAFVTFGHKFHLKK